MSLESKILGILNNYNDDQVFFVSKNKQLEMDLLITDFDYTKGINPYESGENSIYPLNVQLSEEKIIIRLAIILLIFF